MFGRTIFLTTTLIFTSLAGAAVADVKRFDDPTVDGLALDWCRDMGDKCGQPAADAFCRANDYRRTVRYLKSEDPGKETRIISSGATCGNPECDTFVWIECKK
jgi:hypothetical protein